MPDSDFVVDARGLYCPIPILRLAKAFRNAPSGAVAVLLATDPAAVADVEAFCREGGHLLLERNEEAGAFSFRVRRASREGR